MKSPLWIIEVRFYGGNGASVYSVIASLPRDAKRILTERLNQSPEFRGREFKVRNRGRALGNGRFRDKVKNQTEEILYLGDRTGK